MENIGLVVGNFHESLEMICENVLEKNGKVLKKNFEEI